MIHADLVDPSAYTPPYDHALAAALARAGAEVRLITSAFAYGDVPKPDGYALRPDFYRHARGAPASGARRALKLAEHGPDMLRYRRRARDADIVHFQWLTVPTVDVHLLPDRPLAITAHDLLPREPRPGQLAAQRRLYDRVQAVITHTEYGRRTLVAGLGLALEKVHVIPHGAFAHLTDLPHATPLAPELAAVDRPVVLFFGLIRPYKGVELLLDAWQGVTGAELWIVGRSMVDLTSLRARAQRAAGVRLMPGFVPDAALPALFRRADVVVLPYTETERYDFSGVLATALAFGKPTVLTNVGGFPEIAAAGAARLVTAGDVGGLRAALQELVDDPAQRARLAAAAAATALERYSWDAAARATLELYATILRA